MYTVELQKFLLPYIDICCGSCRISRQLRKDWARHGDLEAIVQRYERLPGVNYKMMIEEVLPRYREAIEGNGLKTGNI